MESRGSLLGCQILLVEDDADLREVLSMALEARGASVCAVACAADALMSLVTTPFDVVVSDLALPHETGFWLIRRLRALGGDRHVPVLALTGLPFTAQGVRAAGFDGLVGKPPDIGALAASIASLRRR